MAGHVYLAPDEHDFFVEPGGAVGVRPGRSWHCPSGDDLLSSLAEVFGARACGIVLTGMGEDGAQGIKRIVRGGGMAFAQEPSSCTVAGMPNAALAAGAQSASVSEVPSVIRRLCAPPASLNRVPR
jgi:two-component system chemotaxis response regulator CheB